jgi:plastocyanin
MGLGLGKSKRFQFLVMAFLLGAGVVFVVSCSSNSYPSGGGMNNNPAPPTGVPFRDSSAISIPATITAAAGAANPYSYSPNSGGATITAGQSVYFNLGSPHTADFDDGSGNCYTGNSFSGSVTVTFPKAGTFHFHCGVSGHDSCAATSGGGYYGGGGTMATCNNCTGTMVGMVVVNPAPTATPTSTATVTPTATPPALPFMDSSASSIPVTITAAGGGPNAYVYSPVAGGATITHGQSVFFNLGSPHTANFDNGAGSCYTGNSFSGSVTVTFPAAGTFKFHCAISGHDSCGGTSSCSGCTGTMVGSVVVQ